MRARMKPGCRPVIIDCALVPEYPTYWPVVDSASAAVELLVQDGQVEYEANVSRSSAGTFAVATLQPVAPATAAPAPFARKGGKR